MAAKTLTKKQKAYVEARSKGESKDRSAIMAGVDPESGHGKSLEKSPAVANELARIRAEVRANTNITREDIVFMFQEAANMARIIGDVAGLVASAREMGKILGLYAPEVKKITHDMDANSIRKALKDMSEDELHRLAHGRTIVDAELVMETPALPKMQGDEAGRRVPIENDSGMSGVRGGDTPTDAGSESGSPAAREAPEEGDPEARD